MTKTKSRQLKWKKTVVVEDNEGNRLCLACGSIYDVICPCAPYPQEDTRFCPYCGGEVMETMELDEEECLGDWVVEAP